MMIYLLGRKVMFGKIAYFARKGWITLVCVRGLCVCLYVIWIDEQFWYWYKVITSWVCKLISHFWTTLKQTDFFLRGELDYLWIVAINVYYLPRAFPTRSADFWFKLLFKSFNRGLSSNFSIEICNWRFRGCVNKPPLPYTNLIKT